MDKNGIKNNKLFHYLLSNNRIKTLSIMLWNIRTSFYYILSHFVLFQQFKNSFSHDLKEVAN